MNALDKEIETYNKLLPKLMAQQGKYVLIKGEEVVSTFDSYQDALAAGYAKFNLEPFLVKQIADAQIVAYFTRDTGSQCGIRIKPRWSRSTCERQ